LAIKRTLRAGIIGLGVGEKHIKGYQEHPDVEDIYLCDFDENKLRECGEKYPEYKSTGNPEELLENPEINIVSIASFDNYHHEQVIKALKHGKHVFVEKPICLSEREAAEIRALLNTNPHLKLSCNLNLRTTPRFQRLKDMIDNGELGEVYYLESDYNSGRIYKVTEGWRGDLDFYSVVYGGAIHVVDLICWLVGERVSEVFAYGNKFASRDTKFKYNDFVASIFKFESGRIGKVTVNMGCVYPHFHTLTVYGTQATFINQPDKGLLIVSRDWQERPREIIEDYPGIQKSDLLVSFIDSILGDAEPMVSIEDAFATMSVCFAIEKSMNEARPVKVSYI
jgi:predicted dehydrogenase